jgi:hypothetical protein
MGHRRNRCALGLRNRGGTIGEDRVECWLGHEKHPPAPATAAAPPVLNQVPPAAESNPDN